MSTAGQHSPNTSSPRVSTLPAALPFAETLARGLWQARGDDPMALADILLLLPTRRACRTVREAFLRLSDGQAVVLPRMAAVGDVDAEELSLLYADEGAIAEALALPPAVSSLERRILLARLIQRRDQAQGFDQALSLASALARFLDEVQNAGASLSDLSSLVPDRFSAHWQQTLLFLSILKDAWPAILAERGVMDAAERRQRLIRAQIAAWTAQPPRQRVIAAGTTGTTPAVADLLCLVARLPRGELVLPGVDLLLDDAGWASVTDDHPQNAIKLLLDRLGVDRQQVKVWGDTQGDGHAQMARARWLSQAMRPAATSEAWRGLREDDIPAAAVQGLTYIPCETAQDEADVIALLLREALETPEKTAALVTPDRRLARRVTQSLKRWDIQIDDTGGQPLTEIMAGSYLVLLAEVALEKLAPVSLLALLKHPLTALAMTAEEHRAMVYLLDKVALRGPRPRPGFVGLRQTIAALEQTPEQTRLLAWLDKLEVLLDPLCALLGAASTVEFSHALDVHIDVAERVAETTAHPGAFRVWRGEGGEAAGLFLAELRAASADLPAVHPSGYVSAITGLLKSVTVRPRYGSHPRVFIYGLIEARLASADRMILGGLNEGTWPDTPAQDPWLSRPMRKALGLPQPEAELAQSAHDFVQAASRGEVFLTRARKVDGAPTVPARWLLRMETVLKAVGQTWDEVTAARYLHWLRALDEPGVVRPAVRPAPRPPQSARPRRLSVTQIETLMRDPYQIYARDILKLMPLDPIDDDPGGSERGVFIHAALERFVRTYPDDLPADAETQLLAFGRAALEDLAIPPEVEAFWWPRFERIAAAFVALERDWRASGARPAALEARGEWQMATHDFRLVGKADRIDRMPDGGYGVIDYKTGALPKAGEVTTGLSPQLPLEGVMLRHGAFPQLGAGEATHLAYWSTTGVGKQPVFARCVAEKEDAATMMDEAAQGVQALIAAYDDAALPYVSQPRADVKAKGKDYDHLARVKEWSISSDDDAPQEDVE